LGYRQNWDTGFMERAIDFLRRELSDLERLMKAIENAMERKQAAAPPAAAEPDDRETSVFGHNPTVSLWVD
jgi:hypothetical protein